MKKIIIIALVAIVVIAGGSFTGFAIYNNQPKVVARNAILDTIEDFGEREEIEPILNMLEKGSLEVSAKVDTDELFLGMGEVKASGKVYFSEKALMVEKLSVAFDETEIKADAYIGEDLIYVNNKNILGGSIGAIRGEMAKSFKKSFIAEEMDEETVDLITQLLKDYDNGLDQDLKKDIDKYTEQYLKVAIKALEENAEYTSKNGSVKIGGKKVNARVVTVTIDGETIAAVLESIADELDDDKSLRKTVNKYLSNYEDILAENGILEDDIESFYDDIVEDLEEMAEEAEDYEDKIIVTVATPKLSSKLMQLSVATQSGKSKAQTLFTLDIGKEGIKKTNRLALTIGTDVTYEYSIKENSSNKYTSELNVKNGSEKETLCKIAVDKSKEKFTVTADSVVLSGKFESEKNSTKITVNKLTRDDVAVEGAFEVSITINEKDKMPKPMDSKKVKNVLKMTEDDWAQIAENAEEVFSGSAASDEAEEE